MPHVYEEHSSKEEEVVVVVVVVEVKEGGDTPYRNGG